MYGVVPAAGEGTRLGSLTDEIPKGLVDVADRPLLAHVFETLVDAEVTELFVVIGYRGEKIIEAFGDDFCGTPITYVHQREQLGLGHAVLQTAPQIDGPFVVLNGDNVVGGSIEPAIERMRREEVDAVLAVTEVSEEEARQTGVLELENGRISGLVEKPDDPPSQLVTTGCYVLPQTIFDACRLLTPSDRGEYELSEAVDLLVQAGLTVEPVQLDGWRCNVNTPADVEHAERLLTEDE